MKTRPSIQSEQLRQLFSESNKSLITSTLLATILAYMQFDLIAPGIVMTWLSLIVLIAISRILLNSAYLASLPVAETATHLWLYRFRFGVLAVGMVWGSAGFLMFPASNLQHQMFLIFMLAGLSAGGVVAFSADLFSGMAFSITTLLPIIARLFTLGDRMFLAMGMAGVLYLGFMLLSLRSMHWNITENILLRLAASASEDKIRISEQRYRLLLNHSPIGIFHYDPELLVTYCNEYFADILLKTVDETIGMNMSTLQDQSILSALQNALKGSKVVYEGQYSMPFNENRLWIDMTCAPSRDGAGNIVGGIAIIQDVTDRKQSEEMLRISAIAFESQSAMIVTDPEGVILRVNSAFAEHTGYSAEMVIGQTPRLLNSGRHDKKFFGSLWRSLQENGKWQGEIWNRRSNGLIVAEWLSIVAVKSPDSNVTHYVGTYSDITKNQDAVAEIHRLAYYDPLTQLPNRRLLQDRLGQEMAAASRNGLYGALMFMDLDNFKTLNDTRGHDVGDELLVEVAGRLRGSIRECDIVGRLGGDEFLVILPDLSKNADMAALQAKQVAEKLLETLALPYVFQSYDFHCTASIGIRLYHDAGSAEELLRHADLAMYQAKASGRNTLIFFDPSMQAMATAQADMEKDLRHAIELNQLVLYFQPQLYQNNQLVGAEVLLRWQHPERGVISPLEFIPLAEKTGLILPIGLWVLESVCEQLEIWQHSSQTRHLRLAVNVSPRQFRHPNFVEIIQQMLEKKAINPELLDLELTEGIVLDNINDTILKMNALREMGVRFSLDDFGTGYSSFSYLTKLPLDQLKIDRSFVRNILAKDSDAIIVQTIIGMANNLGMDVIAEGVETKEQLAFLLQHDCHAYQGYLYSKPVGLEDFMHLLKQ